MADSASPGPSKLSPGMLRSEAIARILALCIAIGGWLLLLGNYGHGNLVGGWHGEYVDENGEMHGSGKWRGPLGRFYTAAWLVVPFVFLGTIPSSGLLLMCVCSPAASKSKRVLYVVLACSNIVLLVWFSHIGLWRTISSG